ncbi:MAG: hypothetical protein PHV82_17730 [Victivallaceae bacterium]|nr:hypothetical protein [Victivallaceae bacterium]
MIKKANSVFETDFADLLYEASLDLTRQNGSFSLKDISDVLDFDYDDWELEDELLGNADMGILPGKKTMRFFNREAYFENAEFLIRPTEFEVKNAVLFRGHRLLPFFPEEDACVIKIFDRKGKKLEPKQVETPYLELNICCSLYTPGGGAITAIEDLDIDRLLEPKPESTVVAGGLDLGPFIAESNFAVGDYIKVRIRDYEAGECEIEPWPLARMSSNPTGAAKWKGKFEAGLKKAVKHRKEVGGPFENEDLIAAAFYYAGKTLLKGPACSWLDAVRDSEQFALQVFGERVFVWEKGKLQDYMLAAVEQEAEYDEFPDFDSPDEMEFADMVRIMGFDLQEEILIGYMLDALHFNRDLEDVKKRCFDERIENDYPELAERFDEILTELWDEAGNTEAELRTMESVKIRHELLKLKDRETAFLRALDKSEDFDIENLRTDKFILFSELSAVLEALIIQVGSQPFKSNKEFKTLDRMLGAMADKFDITIEKLGKEFLA